MVGGAKPGALLVGLSLTSLQLLASLYAGPPWGMGLLLPGSLFALFAFAPVGFAGVAGYLSAGAVNLAFWYWIFLYVLERRNRHSG
jgi:hypothetical protein